MSAKQEESDEDLGQGENQGQQGLLEGQEGQGRSLSQAEVEEGVEALVRLLTQVGDGGWTGGGRDGSLTKTHGVDSGLIPMGCKQQSG